jgi:predicted nucleotidyltransferase
MLFKELVDSELDVSIKPVVERLLQLKKEQSEIGITTKFQALNDYIEEKLKYLKNIATNLVEEKTYSWDILNKFFLEAI